MCQHLYSVICTLAGVLAFTVLVSMLVGLVCCRRYRSLLRTIRQLQQSKKLLVPASVPDEAREEDKVVTVPLQQIKLTSRRPWKGLQQGLHVTKLDLSLLQLIKAGKEGVFYQARMNKGTCKGHSMVTCKISKEGVRPKHVNAEVSIMRKLLHHKNVLQLLDWNTTEVPCLLIMEYVNYGTLRTFLQSSRSILSTNPELQSLLTIASYHIALAMQHLHSKMIVHCDLALRNIMVSKFPWEVKVAEFGLARDLTHLTSRHSSLWKNRQQRVPLRWYPPEYFKSKYYSFQGDVWAFGIVLWEMQMFGTLPYPTLETSKSVIYHISSGYKNTNPEGCRQEILDIMQACWQEPPSLRPSFTAIVHMLENVIENDADYVEVETPQTLANDEATCLQAAAVVLDDQSPT